MTKHQVFIRLVDWTRVYDVDADTPRDAVHFALQRFWDENPTYRGRVSAEIA